MKVKKIFLCSILAIFSVTAIFSQVEKSNQPHSKKIQAFAFYEDDLYSTGDDGFVIKWNYDGTGEHYQFSDMEIKMIAVSPNGNDIALYETDGFSVHRISIWNWNTKTRKCAKRFTDSISYLGYTAKGSYLMVGTTSVDGLLFLNSQNGTPLAILKQQTGIANFAKTGPSEKQVITYDPSGKIKYFSLSDGKKKYEFSCEDQLENTFLVHNNRFLVGTKNSVLYVIDATNGETKVQSETQKGIPVYSNEDEFYFIEKNPSELTLTLNKIQLSKSETETRFETKLVRNFEIPGKSFNEYEISCPIIYEGLTWFGLNDGSIYTTQFSESENTKMALPFTEASDKEISDIEIVDNDFFILADNKLLKGTTVNTATDTILDQIDAKNISLTSSKDLILWTKEGSNPVFFMKKSESGYEEVKELFAPSMPVTSLNVYSNFIVLVEGKSVVSLFDINTNSYSEIYRASGIQDAITFDGLTIYASKTAVTSPNSALISINSETKETVPLPVLGEITFGLTSKKSGSEMLIYGISNRTKDGKKLTEIFSYRPSSKSYTSIISWADEDTSAFVRFINGTMFTNIGKSNTKTIDLSSKKRSQLKRSSSLPKKITGNRSYIATLNQDGSLTWYNAQSYARMETWFYSSNDYLLTR